MSKKILNQPKQKKVMKPISMPTDKNCPVNIPLQFEVKRDLQIAKRIKPDKVFDNYKMNVKKTAK